jgi:two-component system response regulator HydG
MAKILVVDDKPMLRDSVCLTLQRAGYEVVAAGNGRLALDSLGRHKPDLVVTYMKMPQLGGLELLENIKRLDSSLPVVVMTAFGTVETAVTAMRKGAFDFVQKPFEGEDLVAKVRRALKRSAPRVEERSTSNAGPAKSDGSRIRSLLGTSAAMMRVRKTIEQIAPSSGTVLIHGESGTGKELAARAVHALSPRSDKVFLAVNCAALSNQLLESELFGHERGAFTGADHQRKGRFELADGGTLLLDEISEMPAALQAKLLRVLQEGEFERVGSSETISIDVRVIATSNRDLLASIHRGEFRRDLYFRLNVLPVAMPALRARAEDIANLTQHFLAQVAARHSQPAKCIDDGALAMLKRYAWPGNVRELGNLCERAHVMSQGPTIDVQLIQPWLALHESDNDDSGESIVDREEPGNLKLDEIERRQIVRVLGRYEGNRKRTAEALGIGVRTLGLKLKKWKAENLVAASL